MPIKSYIVYPQVGYRDQLANELSGLGCDVIASNNRDVLILVTETKGQADEEAFINKLNGIESLDHYSLVSAFND